MYLNDPCTPFPIITPDIGEYAVVCVGFTDLAHSAEVDGITYLPLYWYNSVWIVCSLWNNSFIIPLAPFGAGWSRRCDVRLLCIVSHYTNGSQLRSIFWCKQSGYDENAVMSAKPCTPAKLNWRSIDLSSKHVTMWNCKLYVDSTSC